MIAQLLEFGSKHILLVGIACLILFAIGTVECLQWVTGSRAVSPTQATLLMNRRQAQLLDLREKSDFLKAHLPTAVHILGLSWEMLQQQIRSTQPIIFVSAEGKPPFNLLRKLRAAGFSELYHLNGGIKAWQEAHLPMIHTSSEI